MPLEDDAALERMDRQAQVAGGCILGAIGMLAVLALAVGTLSRTSFGAGHFKLQNPFGLGPYNSLDSLVGRYWFLGLGTMVLVVIALSRMIGVGKAITSAGAGLLLVAFALGMLPIAGYPEHGPGTCQAVISGVGDFGDNDETCFDVRSTRIGDVSIVAAAGIVLVVLGASLGALLSKRAGLEALDPASDRRSSDIPST